MLDFESLTDILHRVHDRFTYVSDISQYKRKEHWVSFNDIPDGDFEGDCEDFAMAVRKELHRIGERSRIAVCGVNSIKANHAVCIFDHWVLDNIHYYPMKRTELANYKLISISDFEANGNWRRIL